MASYPNFPQQPTFSLLSRSFAFCPGARFTGLLDPDFFQSLADQHNLHFGHGVTDTFNEAVTTWAWLTQVLSRSKSCVAATARVLVLCCSLGRPLCSPNAGAFCKARAKLPAAFLQDATRQLGRSIEQRARESWRWHDRSVKLVDGSLVPLPDTPANLALYPQQRSQKPGTSSTCMRLVVVLALATAVLLDAATGPYRGKNSGEMSLLHSLRGQFQAGDIVLADRYYGCYLLLAGLPRRGVDGCFRLPVQKEQTVASSSRLGPDDWLQTWDKPRKPKWLDPPEWAQLPPQIQVRVLRLRVGRPGWRTREVYLVTTLTDPVAYPAADIAALYRARWHAELDLRSLKQTLGLKMLTCQSPALVQAELWMHFLGYNLTRCVLAQAAWQAGLAPRQLSLAAGVQTLEAFRWLLCCSDKDPVVLSAALAVALAGHRVGQRPDRYEPRELKHRQRKYPELKKSRQQRRQELRAPGPQPDSGGGRKGAGKNRPSGRVR